MAISLGIYPIFRQTQFFHWETLEAAAVGKGSSPLFSRLSFCFSRSFLSVSRTHPLGKAGKVIWDENLTRFLASMITSAYLWRSQNFANYSAKEGGSASFGVNIFKRWTHNFSSFFISFHIFSYVFIISLHTHPLWLSLLMNLKMSLQKNTSAIFSHQVACPDNSDPWYRCRLWRWPDDMTQLPEIAGDFTGDISRDISNKIYT